MSRSVAARRGEALRARLRPFENLKSVARDMPAARHEREQADIRIAIILVVNIYLTIGHVSGQIDANLGATFFVMFLAAIAAAVAIRASFWIEPEASLPRRATTVAFDYTILTATIAVGAEYTAPIFALIIWVTVGYGMRYGPWYLLVGTLASILSVIVTGLVSPFWQQHPYFLAMALVTVALVPVYANLLLRETRRSRDAALAADLAKSRFLAQASHDLRQPIHAISLFTACIREEDLSANQLAMADNIDRSLLGVSRLFRSLLDISMLDSGKIVANTAPLDLGRALEGVVARNAEIARNAGVRLRVVPTRCWVRTDGALLETILQNLVSNALKHAPGTDVLVGCRRRGESVSVWVLDGGPGIPEQEPENVFVEFYRLQARGRDVEGIGLGLAIVQRLARLLNLTIRVASRQGSGTLFAIEGLCIAAPPRNPPHPAPAKLRDSQPLAGLRVLLVEDDPQVLHATSLLLRKWGCRVQAETTPAFVPDRPQVIVTDFDLNGISSGLDVVDRVRRETGQDIPALLITGHDEARVREEIGQRDIPLLQKPLHPIQLRTALTMLRRQYAR